ncbi:alpha/beta fold hydrolase [Capillimicrobium parvum]|uniref:2-hydroxy-6-oxo-2,4-heptadienoate hydrolase n=1 Tax=Capillimicrobium parvum TaxID=2884022 RepID=A0A9E6XXQ3_9ACTN|nr:alpha/beta hydrolase [Capillimicrobium parvum]UGS36422.1 2-hydroxy-6-oxo-2,4-heptadienoate hydrolase [Capillimicrobium parvum]
MPFVDANGTRLFHRTSGEGPDVVLIHGLGASHAFWYPKVAAELARHHRVTAYDLRGHGRSAMPASGYGAAAWVADLEGLLDALGIRGAQLVGHSWGGLIALETALRAPRRVAAIVVADSRLVPARRRPGRDALDHRSLERLARAGTAPPAAAGGAFRPFGGWGMGRRSAQRWLDLLAATSAERELERPGFATTAQLSGVRQPALAIYGERSFALASGRRLADTVPDCRLVVLPRVGHFHPAVSPDAFLASVDGFLRR